MSQVQLSKIGKESGSEANWIGYLALALALLGIAIASILIAIAETEIQPNALTCDRLLVAAIAFILWNLFRGDKNSDSLSEPQSLYTGKAIALLLVAGISFAIALALWAWSLTQTSIANSTLLNNMMPIFTTLGGWLVFRQQFSRRFLVGMTVAILGAIAISLGDLQLGESNLTGDGAALVAAMFSAVSILTLENLRKQFTTPVIMQWTCLAGSVFLLPLVWLTEDHLFPISISGWLSIIGLGLISQAIGQGLLTYSLAKFSSGFVAVSMLSIPVIAAFLALLIFAEQLSLFNLLAFAIVLFGIYLAVSANSEKQLTKIMVETK
ncbi:DMT(drug/metabolite transporter) superfamily permease [Xenococcus sp. PCC 7305]|uniref:DMT family transporter n=1 Tax=Xenococcus sp. PCC 7305 TaxID=102125 RepID=UPI0002ACFD0C|nr:DMT family transporter [Xenococcus sp. PCC 7305]ELS05386.1 DMT(drug/metabolite transporter) superfamily permease [Xenococcus sp. PCC 7305]